MSVGSKLKIENRGMFVTSAFYVVAGIIFFVLLVMASFPLHLAVIGISSLVTAYGVFRKRTWAPWFVVILFFVGTTFSAFMVYYIIGTDILLGLGALVYLILTWVFTAYVVMKRKTFEK